MRLGKEVRLDCPRRISTNYNVISGLTNLFVVAGILHDVVMCLVMGGLLLSEVSDVCRAWFLRTPIASIGRTTFCGSLAWPQLAMLAQNFLCKRLLGKYRALPRSNTKAEWMWLRSGIDHSINDMQIHHMALLRAEILELFGNIRPLPHPQ